jgi:microcystin-dependent protein
MVGHKDYTLGDLKWSIQNSDHDFWLKCDGRSLNRTLYPALFSLIGTSYGSDDAQTFKLPDCRGRVVGCIGSGSGLTARSAGDKVGTETHTLTVGEMPTHSHTGTTDSSGTHTHTNNSVEGSLGLATSNGANTAGAGLDSTVGELNLYASPKALTIDSAGEHTHTITTNTTGNSLPHNNMQPTIFIGNVFIAYKTQNAY